MRRRTPAGARYDADVADVRCGTPADVRCGTPADGRCGTDPAMRSGSDSTASRGAAARSVAPAARSNSGAGDRRTHRDPPGGDSAPAAPPAVPAGAIGGDDGPVINAPSTPGPSAAASAPAIPRSLPIEAISLRTSSARRTTPGTPATLANLGSAPTRVADPTLAWPAVDHPKVPPAPAVAARPGMAPDDRATGAPPRAGWAAATTDWTEPTDANRLGATESRRIVRPDANGVEVADAAVTEAAPTERFGAETLAVGPDAAGEGVEAGARRIVAAAAPTELPVVGRPGRPPAETADRTGVPGPRTAPGRRPAAPASNRPVDGTISAPPATPPTSPAGTPAMDRSNTGPRLDRRTGDSPERPTARTVSRSPAASLSRAIAAAYRRTSPPGARRSAAAFGRPSAATSVPVDTSAPAERAAPACAGPASAIALPEPGVCPVIETGDDGPAPGDVDAGVVPPADPGPGPSVAALRRTSGTVGAEAA